MIKKSYYMDFPFTKRHDYDITFINIITQQYGDASILVNHNRSNTFIFLKSTGAKTISLILFKEVENDHVKLFSAE